MIENHEGKKRKKAAAASKHRGTSKKKGARGREEQKWCHSQPNCTHVLILQSSRRVHCLYPSSRLRGDLPLNNKKNDSICPHWFSKQAVSTPTRTRDIHLQNTLLNTIVKARHKNVVSSPLFHISFSTSPFIFLSHGDSRNHTNVPATPTIHSVSRKKGQ